MCDTGAVVASRDAVLADGGGGDAVLGGGGGPDSTGVDGSSQPATRIYRGSVAKVASGAEAAQSGCPEAGRAEGLYRAGDHLAECDLGGPTAEGQVTDSVCDTRRRPSVCGANCGEHHTAVGISGARDAREDDSGVNRGDAGHHRDEDGFCVVDIGTDGSYYDDSDDTGPLDTSTGRHDAGGDVCMVNVITDDEENYEGDADGSLCVYDLGACDANRYPGSPPSPAEDAEGDRCDADGSVYDDDESKGDGAVGNGTRNRYSSHRQVTEDSDPDPEAKREETGGKVEVVKKKKKKHKEKDEKRDKKGKGGKKSKKHKKDKDGKKDKKDKAGKDDKTGPKGDGGPNVKIFQEEARTIVGSSNKIPRSCDPSFLRACPRTIKLIELAFDALFIIAASSPRCHQGIYHLKIISVTLIASVIALTGVVLVLFLRAVPGRCPASCRCLHQQLAYCVFCLTVTVSVGTFHAIYWCDLGRKITVGCAGLSTIIHFIDLLLSIAMLLDHKKLTARDRKRLERKAQPMVQASAGKKK